MIVKVAELRRVTETLLRHVESRTESVEIGRDFYWEVPSDGRYDTYEPPTELSVGQLSDDWAELSRIGQGERDALMYAFVWLGSLFRVIGEDVKDYPDRSNE